MSGATSLYRHFAADGSLLYVGISLSWPARTKQHAGGSKWFDDVAQVKLERFETREDALRAERDAIQREHPRFNIVHNRAAVVRKPNRHTKYVSAESAPKLKTRLASDMASLLLDDVSGTLALVGPPLVYQAGKISVMVAAGAAGTTGNLHELVLGDFFGELPDWTSCIDNVVTIRRPNELTMSEAAAMRREIVWHLRKRMKVDVFDTDLAFATAYATQFPSDKSRRILDEVSAEKGVRK